MELVMRDVVDCFSLFLGRTPDDIASVRHESGQISALLGELLQMQEFRARILSAVLLRKPLPHERISPLPPLRLIDWAQQRLPLDPATRRTLGGARSWTQLLEVLLSDPCLTALAPELDAAGVSPVLRERVRNSVLAEVKRAVVGAVDVASSSEIRGWAVDLCDNTVPVVVEFYAGSVFLGATACGDLRADVQDVVGGSGQYGFKFKVSASHRNVFAAGTEITALDSISRAAIGHGAAVHADVARGPDILSATRDELVQIRRALERIESRMPELGRAASVPLDAYDQYWERFYRPAPDVLADQRLRSAALHYRPLLSVIVSTSNADPKALEHTVLSVLNQTYDHWELILVDDLPAVHSRVLKRHSSNESRIRWLESAAAADSSERVAVNINQCLAAASGDYVAFLDPDTELASEALFTVAGTLQKQRWGLIYSDEDRIEIVEGDPSERRIHHTPVFKTDLDPDLLLATNYIRHFLVMRREVVSALGGLHTDCGGCEGYDLTLRAVAHLPQDEILHIPRVLHHWKPAPATQLADANGCASTQKGFLNTVERYLKSQNLHATVEAHTDPVGTARPLATRVRWQLPSPLLWFPSSSRRAIVSICCAPASRAFFGPARPIPARSRC